MADVLATLRAAIDAQDLDALGAVLADDVRWEDCRSRADVLATLREQFASAPPQLLGARSAGDRIVLRLALPGVPGEGWFMLALDRDGLICELRGYAGEAALEHDLALIAAGPRPEPSPGVGGLVPFVHVADMARSLAFYALLGLEPVDTYEPEGDPVWAFLESRDGARLMLARAGEPIDRRRLAVLFYLYAGDLAGLRDHLVAHGVAAGEIEDGTPGPKEEMRVFDPDGYVLMIARTVPDA